MRPLVLLALLALASPSLVACYQSYASRVDDRTFRIEGPEVPGGSHAPNRRREKRSAGGEASEAGRTDSPGRGGGRRTGHPPRSRPLLPHEHPRPPPPPPAPHHRPLTPHPAGLAIIRNPPTRIIVSS